MGYTNLKQIRFDNKLLKQKLFNFLPRLLSKNWCCELFSNTYCGQRIYLRTHELWFSTIKHMTAIVFCDVQHFSMSWSDKTSLDEKISACLASSNMFLSSLHHLVLFRCTIARYIKGGLYQSGSGESVLDVLVQNPRRSIWRAGHIWWPDTRANHPPDGVCRRENNSLQSADHGWQKPG